MLAPFARLLLLVVVCAAIWWEPTTNTLREDLLTIAQWGLLLALVLGFLLVPRKALQVVLRGVALTFLDVRRLFARLDQPWRHVERGVVVLAAVAMTSLTFLSVVHRNFNGRVGDTGVTWLGVVVDPSPDNGAAVAKAVTLWLVLSVLIVMATERSLRGRRPTAVRIGLGVGFSVAFYVFCRVFVALLPTNIPGALTMSLGALLYLAFFGAAIAAAERKHLSVDAVRKAVPDRLQPLFAFLGLGAGALFCGFLAWLGALQVWSDYSLWASDHALKVYESVPVPYWTVRLAIPIGLAVAALRLAGHACDDLWYGPPEEDENAAIANSGVKLDQEALDEALAQIKAEPKREATV